MSSTAKRVMSVFLVLSLMISVCISGCSKSGGTSTAPAASSPATSAASSTPAPAAEADEGKGASDLKLTYIDASKYEKKWNLDSEKLGKFELSFTTHDPATSMKTKFQEEWAKVISNATNGGVNITVYSGATLAAPNDALNAVKLGTADIGWICTSFFSSQLPIVNLANLAMVGLDNDLVATNVLWDLYGWSAGLQKELANYKVLMMYANGGNFICTKDVQFKTLDDIKGLKLRTIAGTSTDMIGRLGATPITMGPGDIYDALSKGVINGYALEWSGINSFNLQEATDYYSTMNIFTVPFLVIMDLNIWNGLPAEYQEVISYYSMKEMSLLQAKAWQDEWDGCAAAEDPSQFVDVTGETNAQCNEIAEAYNAERAKSVTTADFNGMEYLTKMYELADKYKAELGIK